MREGVERTFGVGVEVDGDRDERQTRNKFDRRGALAPAASALPYRHPTPSHFKSGLNSKETKYRRRSYQHEFA